LTNYFKEKETQLHKELGTHEAKRAITEENVSESVKKILETEESLTLYKSQVRNLSLFYVVLIIGTLPPLDKFNYN
jgi:hypothetical protein